MLDDENVIIVDSLPPDSYNGDPNSSDRSGHIPGSVNVFFGLQSNFETKQLYPDEAIRENFEKAGVLDPIKRSLYIVGLQLRQLG